MFQNVLYLYLSGDFSLKTSLRKEKNNMIYVTGDTHGDLHRFTTENFPEQKEMTKNDYVIILGDFGVIWSYQKSYQEEYWLDWLENKPFTTLFIDGNHENFERLYSYPTKTFNGGKVHEIRPSVLHLQRGEVFLLENHKFFAFGGASSHDVADGILDPVFDSEKIKKWSKDYTKMFRIDKISWWEQELPSQEEKDNGIANLAQNDNKVDFILTHCAPASTVALIGQGLYEQDHLTQYLEELHSTIDYRCWLFGHYHDNRQVNDKEIMLYEQIIRIL